VHDVCTESVPSSNASLSNTTLAIGGCLIETEIDQPIEGMFGTLRRDAPQLAFMLL
jgi:hypothetical protein